MVKIANFFLTIHKYYCQPESIIFPDIYGCPNPLCHYSGRLRKHGFYRRNALSSSCYLIPIQRYLCPVCKKTTSCLPSSLVPRFQYSIAIIILSLFLISVRGLTLTDAARLIRDKYNLRYFSRQHIQFYRRRLLKNFPMIQGFFSFKGIFLSEKGSIALISSFTRIVIRIVRVEPFNLSFFEYNSVSFMAKV